jgi:hypothetical protein
MADWCGGGISGEGWIGLVGVMGRAIWMHLLEGISWIGGKGMACVGGWDRWDSFD